MPSENLSPTAFAKKITNIKGMISCIEPVVSITSTVMEMVMRVAPPKLAAAPRTAYVCRSTGMLESTAPTMDATPLP